MSKIIYVGYSHAAVTEALNGLQVNVHIPYLQLNYRGLNTSAKKYQLFLYQNSGIAEISGSCGYVETNSEQLAAYVAQRIHNFMTDDVYAVEDADGNSLFKGSFAECEMFVNS